MYELYGLLTVQRNVNGNTIAPRPGSLKTKLEPPNMPVDELPNEQPVDILVVPSSTAEYSLRHKRNAVEQEGQPSIENNKQ